MKFRPLIAFGVVLLLCVAACKSSSERRKQKSAPPKRTTTHVTEAVAAGDSVVDQALNEARRDQERLSRERGVLGFEWENFRPPSRARGRGTMTVREDAVVLKFAGVAIPLDRPLEFGPCESDDAVRDDEESTDEERRAAYWLLRLDGRRLALELHTRGLRLLARDQANDCVRAMNLNDAVLGTQPDDPVFDLAPFDSEEEVQRATFQSDSERAPHIDADVIERRPAQERLTVEKGEAVLTSANRPLLTVSFSTGNLADWTASLAARPNEFVRFVLEGDRDGPSSTTMSHRRLIGWTLPESGEGFDSPALDLRSSWGGDEEGNEDEAESILRRWPLPEGGVLVADGERHFVDVAMMLGVGRCPQMEGLADLSRTRTTVRWSVERDGGTRKRLGTSTASETRVSGCPDEVRREVESRKSLASGLNAPRVDWK